MNDRMVQKLLKKRHDLVKRIPRSASMIRGSLVTSNRKCGKPNCRCQRGEKHSALYISQNRQGKTIMTYVPKKAEQEVTQSVQRYKKLLAIIEELTTINLQLLQYRK